MSTNPSPLVCTSSQVTAAQLPLVGGKGVNLARLIGFSQPVPPWYAITTEAFRRTLEHGGLDRRIAERRQAITAPSGDGDPQSEDGVREIRQWIQDSELPPELDEAIARCHEQSIPAGALVAVRSSAPAEDAATDSFAGLHDSFLFVRGDEALRAAVKQVWASAYNQRALAYRRARGISLDDVAVAVVVQQMVDATTSGVMFTVNPNTADVHEVVVSSLWGAGEGLVSAGLDADTFVVDKATRTIRTELATKEEQLTLDEAAGGGLRRQPVPAADRDRSSLSEEQVRELTVAGIAIERAFGRPQDVEFSFDREGRPFIVQARPVTTVEEYGPAAGNQLVWDNSNIIESYSGVTTPMTFSVIRRAYTIVYHCFAEVMGIAADTVRRNESTFANMLGLFRGQVYYNLRNWYRLIRLFPGYQYNAAFMESMMGVQQSTRFGEDEPSAPGWRHRYFVELPALLRLVGRSVWNFLRIRRLVGGFEEHFRTHYDRWSTMDFSALAPHELMAVYQDMEERMLRHWKAPIINDFFVMVFYGTLKKLCVTWCGDAGGSLQNDLVCGEGGIESTEPTRMLITLAHQASRDPELRALLLERAPAELAAELPGDGRFAAFSESIRRYLDLYGFRCVNELKLEEYSLRDRPAFLYQMIRNYLALPDQEALDVERAHERERRIRRQAEKTAFGALGHGLLPRRLIFRRVLANARLGVKNRENMRFARTRIYGLLRELLRAAGDCLRREGILDATDDVFYLTIDELADFIKGTAVTTDLAALAALRRREFDAYRDDRERFPDDRFETFGMAYHRNRFKGRPVAAKGGREGHLEGIGCCPGVVTGAVKVLRSPAEDASLAGEILVAERTDPGWVPLYPAVSGLLIERGSILSHSAIVAREMGIPTIVAIPGLTAALESGRYVTMDGKAGTVCLVDEGSG
ncbi:MAG: phosphoenolpyruvate synthase [bacterium]|nr:phosphoenolpyruvate synthase [bacterium]